MKICEWLDCRERSFKKDGSRWQELIGIELELENVDNDGGAPSIPYWDVKSDNSLRNGIEYVLDAPYAGPSLEAAIDAFYEANVRSDNSSRTSTHIHINMTDSSLAVVRSMTMIMYTIEDAVYNIVDEGRKWAGYSMALSEMEPARLREAMSSRDDNLALINMSPTRNQERYYGFNTAAIRRHGTVEFRYFPGGPSREELESWIDLVIAVKNMAVAYSPEDLINRIQEPDDITRLLNTCFPNNWSTAILNCTPSSYLLNKFNQIAALTVDPDTVGVQDRLVFLTPSFLKYMKTCKVGTEGGQFLDKIVQQVQVVSPQDWTLLLREAMSKDNIPTKATPPKKKAQTTRRTNRPILTSDIAEVALSSSEAPVPRPEPTANDISYRAMYDDMFDPFRTEAGRREAALRAWRLSLQQTPPELNI